MGERNNPNTTNCVFTLRTLANYELRLLNEMDFE